MFVSLFSWLTSCEILGIYAKVSKKNQSNTIEKEKSSAKGNGKLDTHMEKINFNTYLILYIKINENISPTVRSKILKLLEQNTGDYLYDLELDKSFLDHRKQ